MREIKNSSASAAAAEQSGQGTKIVFTLTTFL
jgi:hypothetical protein